MEIKFEKESSSIIDIIEILMLKEKFMDLKFGDVIEIAKEIREAIEENKEAC